MTVETLTTMVLLWMTRLLSPDLAHGLSDDRSVHRWADTYPSTAAVIADASVHAPAFKGEDGARKTAAMLTALAFHESRFDPRAVGDHGSAFGLYQIHRATVGPEATKEDLFDPEKATRTALDLLKTSFRICASHELVERMGWYAAGGEGCKEAGRRKSRVRMGLAMRIAKEDQP